MIILKLLLVILLLFFLALLWEKMFHMSYSLEQVVYQLKSDMAIIAKSLISKEMVRHNFNIQLAEELKKVARPYSNTKFDIDVGAYFNSGTPFIGVRFIPQHKLEVEELKEVSNLLLLKFRIYLLINGLNWKTFTCYSSGHYFVKVYLYYAEYPRI